MRRNPTLSFHLLLILLAVAILVMPTGGRAQGSSPLLLDLQGQLASIRYSPGSLDRAANLQDPVELLVENFDTWGKEKIPLLIYILSPDDWSQFGLQDPYGMPSAMGGRGIAIPAWGTEESVQLWHGLMKTRLPTTPTTEFRRGSPEETSSLLVSDIVALPELAKILLISGGFRSEQPWTECVAAQAVSLSYVLLNKDQRLPEMRLVYSSLGEAAGGARAFTLQEAASSDRREIQLWFDAQCFAAATIMAQDGGKQPAKEMLKAARKNGREIRSIDLISSFPGLDNWLRTSFKEQ